MRALVTEAKWRGIWGTVRALKMNKFGTMHCYVDSDSFGNRYFENKEETYGRHRWVEYAETRNYDSLKIPPDWHAWLHHNSDVPPSERPLEQPIFQSEVTGNPTGTDKAYYPPGHPLHKRHGAVPLPETYQVCISLLISVSFDFLTHHLLIDWTFVGMDAQHFSRRISNGAKSRFERCFGSQVIMMDGNWSWNMKEMEVRDW